MGPRRASGGDPCLWGPVEGERSRQQQEGATGSGGLLAWVGVGGARGYASGERCVSASTDRRDWQFVIPVQRAKRGACSGLMACCVRAR